MISYHGTSTYSYGTSISMTRTRSRTDASPPYAATYQETARSTRRDGAILDQTSIASTLSGTEVVDHDGDTTTVAVARHYTRNHTGSTHSVTTYTYTDFDGTSADLTTSTASGAFGATSVSLTTSATTSTGLTSTRTTTATVASSSHTLTTNAAGASVTTSAAATATVTTSTTSTGTRSTAITTGSTFARVADMGTFTVFQAATDEVMALGAPMSSNIENLNFADTLRHRAIGTDLSITASRTVSVTNWNTASTTFTVPPALTTYTYTGSVFSLAGSTASFSLMTSTTSTGSVADTANQSATATATLTVWSTATSTSSARFAVGTATSTATYLGSQTTAWRQGTLSARVPTTRSFWGHGAGLTVTTHAAHCRASTRTIELSGFTGGFVIVTATSTTTELVDQQHSTTATTTYHEPAFYFDEQQEETGNFIEEDITEALGVSYTISGLHDRTGNSHELALRYAARAHEPGFLPARQPWSAYSGTDARYMAMTISADGSTTTAKADGSARTVHYAQPETSFSHTNGAAQSAAEVRESHLASYTWGSNTVFTSGGTTWGGFTYAETGDGDVSTRGLGGYERKRPSFSDLAAVSVGAWQATTQEGTTTGTTTHASTLLTGSDARRTAFEPVAVVRAGSAISPVLGSFKTTNYAA